MWRAFARVPRALECGLGVGQQQLTLTQHFPHSKARNFCRTSYLSKHILQPIIMTSSVKPKVVFVLGGPGAGKGTQCSKIVNRFLFTHLSAGDLLREERTREGSEFGSLIEDYIRNGKIVPVEITCSLLENAMKNSGKSLFLIDGFPRNQDNLDGWNRQMSDKVDVQFVLFFDCDEEVCVKRCLIRGQGGSGRSDDNLESLKKRIQTYNNDSMPIIKYFDDAGQVKRIDASPDADQVFREVERTFMTSGF
ncbi:UMP-CMP kinase [Drosophila pseudoobscura]|uniref:UMP-CMP kinase n=1 Tax=Drosophila pseudoobscura pseudoobscura TaxID=46245 RepID=A0A6I8UQF7_DROPS|nr:UMP-CMP kinase [Drosophila pseudoobscura]